MQSKQWGRVVGGVVAVIVCLVVWRLNVRGELAWERFPALNGGFYSQPLVYAGQQTIIPPEEVFKATRSAETTPALVNPAMIPVGSVTADYFDDVEGIALEINGDARFYSFQILNWHEIVQDTVGGTPVTITYSTLCGSAAVYKETGPVKLAGQVYNNCSLLTDEANNLWFQPVGLQVMGQNPGQAWAHVPSEVIRFKDWYEKNPTGQVLSLNTGHERVYGRHPFGSYDTSTQVIYPLNHRDEIIQLKDLVWDVYDQTGARLNLGISRALLSKDMLLEAEVQGQAVVAFMNNRTATAHIFSATLNGQRLTFKRAPDGVRFVDQETGSTWTSAGLAVEGRLKGQALTRLSANRMFGFAYVALAPTAILPGYAEAVAVTTPEDEPSGQTLKVEDGSVTVE